MSASFAAVFRYVSIAAGETMDCGAYSCVFFIYPIREPKSLPARLSA